MSAVDAVVSLVAGLFGGAGWGYVSDTWIKPPRERKRLLAALGAEIAFAASTIDAAITAMQKASGANPPAGFAITTLVYSSVADRLDVLEEKEIAAAVELYAKFDQINRLIADHAGVRVEIARGEQQPRGDLASIQEAVRQHVLTLLLDAQSGIRKLPFGLIGAGT